jgi:transcriptional regulator of NAD metabolism
MILDFGKTKRALQKQLQMVESQNEVLRHTATHYMHVFELEVQRRERVERQMEAMQESKRRMLNEFGNFIQVLERW